MSRVLDTLKKADEKLPQSDKGLNFPGKGFLTALVDTSGSELKRQTKQEDDLKHAMVQPLIERYWHGDLSDEERSAVADQIKKTLGGGKNTKATLDRIFEVGGQIHATNKMLKPPPGASDAVASQAVQASNADQAGPEEGAFDTTGVLPPPPAPTAATPALATSAPPVASATPSAAGPAPTPQTAPTASALSSALTKMFPTGMTEKEKIDLQHKNTMEVEKARTDAAMTSMQAQIDAGRFEKNMKTVKSTEIDPKTGKTMSVLRWFNSDGTEVKKDILGEAPRNWASKPTRIFARDEGGQIFSEMVDPLTGQRVTGTERRYDILPPAGYLDKISQRQAIFVDDDQIIHLEPLTTIRSVQLPPAPGTGGLAPPPSSPATLPGGGPGGVGGPGTSPVGAGTTPAIPGSARPQLSATTLPGLHTPSSINTMIGRSIPIREAYTAAVGSPEFPDSPSMMTYASIADDPARRNKLARALKTTFDGLEQDEKAHGSLTNLLKLYAGIPTAEVNAQLATYGDVIGKELADDPELQQAYNATMTMFGNTVALRSLTKAGAAQANVKRIEQEIPVIGVNSYNSRDVYGKLAPLIRTAYNGALDTPTVKQHEKDYLKQKLDELTRRAAGTYIAAPPAGKAGPAAASGAAAGTVSVSYGGRTYKFPTQKDADNFKRDMGIKQ